MSREYLMFGFLGFFWLAGLASCGVALLASHRGSPRWFWGSLVCALIGIAIGYVGVWTPFSLWPQISYNFSAGGVQRSIDFRWPFILPLILGAVALLLVVRKHFSPMPQEKNLGFRSSKLEAES